MIFRTEKSNYIPERALLFVFTVLLVLTVALFFTPALTLTVQDSHTTSSHPNSPKYDSAPMAFNLNCDIQRVKRMIPETSRLLIPTTLKSVHHRICSYDCQPALRQSYRLPLLATPSKGYRQVCQLLDIPPPVI
ncbi:MAG: hypothetical protein PHR56_07725 [Dehalococcoidales bacterium]|nr:hypothetical protein [Dehalococcoidales bacterium]